MGKTEALTVFASGIKPWLDSWMIDEAIAALAVRSPDDAMRVNRQRCTTASGVVILADGTGSTIARYNRSAALTIAA